MIFILIAIKIKYINYELNIYLFKSILILIILYNYIVCLINANSISNNTYKIK